MKVTFNWRALFADKFGNAYTIAFVMLMVAGGLISGNWVLAAMGPLIVVGWLLVGALVQLVTLGIFALRFSAAYRRLEKRWAAWRVRRLHGPTSVR